MSAGRPLFLFLATKALGSYNNLQSLASNAKLITTSFIQTRGHVRDHVTCTREVMLRPREAKWVSRESESYATIARDNQTKFFSSVGEHYLHRMSYQLRWSFRVHPKSRGCSEALGRWSWHIPRFESRAIRSNLSSGVTMYGRLPLIRA